MRRLLLATTFSVVFAALLWVALQPGARHGEPAEAEPAATTAPAFALKLSTRLSSPPLPTTARPPAPRQSALWQQPAAQRTAAFLLAASVLGLALGAAWRRAPVATHDGAHTDPLADARDAEPADQGANLVGSDDDFSARLEAATADLREALAQERGAMDDLRAHAKSEHEAMSARHDELQASVDDWQQRFDHADTARERHEADLHATRTELEDARLRLEQLEQDLGHSREELAQRQADFQETQRNASSLSHQVDQQLADLDAAGTENARLREQVTAAQEAGQRLEHELAVTRDELETVHTDKLGLLENVHALNDELGEREQRINALEQDSEDLATLRVREESLRDQLALAEARIEELSATESSLGHAIAERDEQLQSAQVQSTALAERLGQRERDFYDLEIRVRDLDERLEESAASRQELQAQLVDVRAAHDEQHVIIVELESGLYRADAQESHLRADVDAGARQIDALHEELELLTARHDNIVEQKGKLEQRYRELDDAHGEIVAELNSTSAALHSARDENAQLRADIDELEQIRTRLAQWQPTVDSYRADLRAKNTRIEALTQRCNLADHKIADLRAVADEAGQLRVKLNEQTALARVLKDGADTMRLYKASADRRKRRIEELDLHLNAKREQADRAEQELACAMADAEGLRQQIDEAQRRYEELEDVASRRAEHVLSLEQQLADKVRSLSDAYDELQRQRAERERLAVDLDEFMSLSADIEKLLATPAPAVADETPFDAAAAARLHTDGLASLRAGLERIAELEETLAASTRQLHDAESAMAGLSGTIEEREAQLDRTQTELAAARQESAALDERVNRQREALHDAQQDQQRAQQLQTRLDEQLAHEQTVIARIETVVSQHQELKQQFDALTRELDARTEHAGGLSEQRDALEDKLTEALETHATLERQHRDVLDLRDELQNRLGELEDTLAQRIDQIEALGVRAQEHEALHQRMQGELAQREAEHASLLGRIEEADARDEHMAAQLEQANAHNEQIAAQLDEAKAHDLLTAAELEQTNARNEQLAAQLDEAKAHDLRTAQQLEETNARNEQLAAQLDQSSAHGERMAAQLEEAENRARAVEDATQQMSALEDEIEALRVKAAALDDERRAATDQCAELSEELSSLEEQLDRKSQALEDTDAQRTALESKLADVLERDLSHTQKIKALSEHQVARDDLNHRLATLGDELAVRERELDELLQAIGDAGGDTVAGAAAADRVRDMARQLQTKDGRIDELARANLGLRDSMREVRDDAQTRVQRLRAHIERTEKTAHELTLELEKANREQRRSAGHATRAEQLQASLERSQARIRELETALADYEARMDTLLPKAASGSGDVPVLTRPVGAPPVLTRTVAPGEENE
jgi:chromosome segregation ATPase